MGGRGGCGRVDRVALILFFAGSDAEVGAYPHVARSLVLCFRVRVCNRVCHGL